MSKINNYNLFLKKLDEKGKKKEVVPPKNESSENKDLTFLEEKRETLSKDEKSKLETEIEFIKNFIKQVEDTFSSYQHDSDMFTGKINLDHDLDVEKEKDREKKEREREREKQKEREKRKKIEVNSDEKRDKKEILPKIKKTIDVEVNHIQDLIRLAEENPLDETVEYNINIQMLHQIKEPLNDLNNMIGMHELKLNVVHQILYFMQNLHKNNKQIETGDFMHTVIYGPPGTGKTEIAKIIGKLYSKMGILKRGVFKKVTRADLVASYLGQTAAKTREVILECLGGVLFIDEAYALGNNEKRDSFSKECIDTLCEALSDHKENLMVIIAGYEKELKECFFNYNPGLDSRFQWRFHTEKYDANEMFEIFKKKVQMIDWRLEKNVIGSEWFEKKKDYFVYYGRDIEILLSKIKISHAKRVFCKPEEEKKIINVNDLEKGFQMFLENEEVKKRKETLAMKEMIASIYV